MATKSVKALQAQIKRQNAEFNALTPAAKRVAIARDVIAQLTAGKYNARQGVYVQTHIEVTENNLKKDASLLLTQSESCTVCGIGGLVVSAICKADSLPVKSLKYARVGYDLEISGPEAYKYLKKFFNQRTLNDIESAFEQHRFGVSNGAAADFGEDVDDGNERLRLIMENIVVNKGRFVPSQKPVLKWTTPNFVG